MKYRAKTCPKCGAAIVSINSRQPFVCEYCGSVLEKEYETTLQDTGKTISKSALEEIPKSVGEQLSMLMGRVEVLKGISAIREINEKEQEELSSYQEIIDELTTIVAWIESEKNKAMISVDDELAADGRTIYYVKMTNNSGYAFDAFSMEATFEGIAGSAERVTFSCKDWRKGQLTKMQFYSWIPEIEARSINLDVKSICYKKLF